MARPKNELRIPEKTLDVSRARYQLTRLLRRLRTSPRVYRITQMGKPAGALVNLEWLEAVLTQVRGKRRFSLFGQAVAARDWEQTLARLRQALPARTLGRHGSDSR